LPRLRPCCAEENRSLVPSAEGWFELKELGDLLPHQQTSMRIYPVEYQLERLLSISS
jgi:hypothetical protein